jgi:hypothetical protein
MTTLALSDLIRDVAVRQPAAVIREKTTILPDRPNTWVKVLVLRHADGREELIRSNWK